MTIDLKKLDDALDMSADCYGENHGDMQIKIIKQAARAYHTQQKAPPVDHDMSDQQLRLYMGELSAYQMRIARAAIRWANSSGQQKAPEQDGVMKVWERIEAIVLSPNNPVGGAMVFDDLNIIRRAITQRPAAHDAKCKGCNGNDGDVPCAYPRGGRDGCLRDVRLGRAAPPSEVMSKHKPDLKGCPFCGTDDVGFCPTDKYGIADPVAIAMCRNLECKAEQLGSTDQEAIDRWNRRALQQNPTNQAGDV